MKYKYFTIEREYGSGGTKVARTLAEELNIPCYGRELLEMVSAEKGIDIDKIQRYEETVTNSFLYTVYMMFQAQTGQSEGITTEGHIFLAEQGVIHRLAEKGPAIFLGHCATEALNNKSGVLKVFITSDKQSKMQRVINEYKISEKDADSTMKRFDRKRANYYCANTGKKWNNPKNYDIVLDSGKLGIDGCVSALKGFFQN